jgi:hypothetical protein
MVMLDDFVGSVALLSVPSGGWAAVQIELFDIVVELY